MARPPHSRNDLIELIRGRGRVTACNRAIENGIVTVLGGFTALQGIPDHSWVVSVKSKYGRIWNLAVFFVGSECRVREIGEVDWTHWAGNGMGQPSIYNGDDPEYFYYKYMMAIDAKENPDGTLRQDTRPLQAWEKQQDHLG